MSVYSDVSGANTAKGDMANAVDGMRWTLKQVSDEVQAARGWSGTARVAFNDAADAWGVETKKLNDLLDRITEQVGSGTQQFQRMDGEGEDEFKYIRL